MSSYFTHWKEEILSDYFFNIRRKAVYGRNVWSIFSVVWTHILSILGIQYVSTAVVTQCYILCLVTLCKGDFSDILKYVSIAFSKLPPCGTFSFDFAEQLIAFESSFLFFFIFNHFFYLFSVKFCCVVFFLERKTNHI